MKEIMREYGHTTIAVIATYAMVKTMEYLMLGSNGFAEILFQLFA